MKRKAYLVLTGTVLVTIGWILVSSARLEERPPEEKDPRLILQLQHLPSSLALSTDGKWLVSGSHDFMARLFELATGKEVRTFRGHTSNIYSVALSEDGKRLATGSDDNTARVWDMATGRQLKTFAYDHAVVTVALSGDGKRLAAAGSKEDWRPDGNAVTRVLDSSTVLIWDVDTGKKIRGIAHTSPVAGVALSGNGEWLVTASDDKSAQLWEVDTGKLIRAFRDEQGTRTLALSGDGKWLATAEGKNAIVWELATGKKVRSFTHSEWVRVVSLSADGKRLAAGAGTGGISGPDNALRLWDTATGKEVGAFGGPDWIYGMAVSADGNWVASTGHNCNISVSLWQGETGKLVRSFDNMKTVLSGTVAMTRDGKWLVTSSAYGDSTRIWNLAQGTQTRVLKNNSISVPAAAIMNDGTRLITDATLWNLSTGEQIREFAASDVSAVALTRDGKWLLTGYDDRRGNRDNDKIASFWDLASGKEVHVIRKNTEGVGAVAITSDNQGLVTGGGDGIARWWELATGKELRTFRHGDRITSVALTGDDKFLVTAGWDKSARLWNVATGAEVRTFRGHTEWLTSLSITEDGKWLVTGSDDRTARLWDMTTGKQIRVFKGHTNRVTFVALTGDGKRMATGSNDDTTRLWDVATGKELCQVASFYENDWAVFDADGRFDASNVDEISGLHWVSQNQSFALKHYKDRFYDPGLLAKYMGFNREPLRKLEAK